MTRRCALPLAIATALAATAGVAATYTVNVTDGLNLQSVASAAVGDTVFRISPSTGSVTVVSGGGRRLSATSVRATVTVTCRPSRSADAKCSDDNVAVKVGPVGGLSGRARALTNFTVSPGTAVIVGPPSGGNPLTFTLAPPGNNSAKSFFIGADFPVAGDDSGLPSGNGENSFYVQVVDNLGLPFASDTDKGKVKALRALSVAKTADLAFGRIQIPTSGASTITLNPATGARTATGTAFLFPTPAPTRAAFTISGEGGQQVSVTLPSSITLTGPTSTLPVTIAHTAAPSPTLTGGLGAAGSYSFHVGGSFGLTSASPTGNHSGVLTVNVDYN